MPAYFNEGFFVRVPAWHGMGKVLSEYPGRDEAMILAGHNFKVLEGDIMRARNGRTILTHKELYREDQPNADAPLAVVNKSYTVVQNSDAWDIVDAIVRSENVKYDTAGVLKDGAVLWVMALVDEPVQINGDPSLTIPYVSCSWAHDGSAALVAKMHATRIVCANTAAAAESEAKNSGRIFSFRHTVNVMARIEEAREALKGLRSRFADFVELSNDLASLSVSEAGIDSFILSLRPASTQLISERVRNNEERDRALIRSYLDGPTCEGIRNTAYGLVQAGIEFLDHGRKYRNTETLLNRTVLKGEPLKDKLVTLAREAALV